MPSKVKIIKLAKQVAGLGEADYAHFRECVRFILQLPRVDAPLKRKARGKKKAKRKYTRKAPAAGAPKEVEVAPGVHVKKRSSSTLNETFPKAEG